MRAIPQLVTYKSKISGNFTCTVNDLIDALLNLRCLSGDVYLVGGVIIVISVKQMHKSKMLSVNISPQYINRGLSSPSIDKCKAI